MYFIPLKIKERTVVECWFRLWLLETGRSALWEPVINDSSPAGDGLVISKIVVWRERPE